MRFFFLNQYYPPDGAPTGRVLQDLACQLVRDGHSVTVFCSRSLYGGADSVVHEEKGLDVREVPSFPLGRKHVVQKLLHYASFYLVLFFKLLLARQRPDVIVALTTPTGNSLNPPPQFYPVRPYITSTPVVASSAHCKPTTLSN
ncbi:hypothetical protein N9V94_02595 [bacterium]|nr:hypothetical protein [bacterium]